MSTYNGFKALDSSAEYFFVITQNNSFGPPDAAYCSAVRDSFNLTMPVLYDPSGTFASDVGGGNNAWSFAISEGSVLEGRGQYGSAYNSNKALVESLLAP